MYWLIKSDLNFSLHLLTSYWKLSSKVPNNDVISYLLHFWYTNCLSLAGASKNPFNYLILDNNNGCRMSELWKWSWTLIFSPDLTVRANDSTNYLHCIKKRLSVMIKVMELFINYFHLFKFPSISSYLIPTIFYTLFQIINSRNVIVDILPSRLTVIISADIRPSAFRYLSKVYQLPKLFFIPQRIFSLMIN